MGCTNSKVDDLPAVALCRERSSFLDEAIRQRYAFAESHVAYLHSLNSVGLSLHRFFTQLDLPSSPLLNLPPQPKILPPDPPQPSDSPIHHLHSHSDSGSHLHFHSDDDDDHDDDDHDHGSASDSLHHHDVSSPLHHRPYPYAGYLQSYDSLNLNLPEVGAAGGFININYMKNQTTQSMVYTQQRPMTPETMHMGQSSSSSSSYYPNYPNYNFNAFPNYPNYGGGGLFAASPPSQPPYSGGFSSGPAVASSSKEPPPPPSPPRSSTWDFLNPFESFEKFYPPYTPSRDSREVREEEGIPELEDDDDDDDDGDDDEVVKEVHGDQKFVDSERSNYSKPGVSEENGRVTNDAELQYKARPSVGMESDPVEYEVHVMDKKVVDAGERSKNQGNAAGFKASGGFKGDGEVVKEIQVQFERASESGSELALFLEVGKVQYKRKQSGHHVSSKILHLPVVSSQPSTSRADPAYFDVDQDMELRSKSLSSTLHKLYLWEKKLYEEVKVEEKMRVLHERKSRKLKRLDERGAEAQKIDATRILVRNLSTNIRIAIQVVDKISVKINNLRDDELWPQLNEFIQGLVRMWKSMLECHHNQCEAIGEAKRLDAIAFRKHLSDDHFEATRQLEHDLVNWTLSFSNWIGAQKSYVRALNGWLMKCLLYVPEETPDGIAPFSPSRVGAPPVFVICNQWSQSLDTISMQEVINSMRNLSSNVLQLWDRDKTEIRQRMLANKEERKIRSLDKEEEKIQKEIQALDKRMVLTSGDDNGMPLRGHVVYQSETTTKGGSLQASLQHVLEAMKSFTASSLKVYEELLQRIEEDHLAREHDKVS